MTVKELISLLRMTHRVEFREDNYYLCDTETDSNLMGVFCNRKIKDWFCCFRNGKASHPVLVINIESEG